MGNRRGSVLAVWSDDPVLAWIGPVGLALAAGTALIVDLIGPGTGRSLADFAGDGPRLAELSPGRPGVATISAGSLDPSLIDASVKVLARSWPSVVIRSDGERWDGPTVPYRGVYPGSLLVQEPAPGVWQPAGGSPSSRLPGIVLPRLPSRSVRMILSGSRPFARRWINAWGRAWEMPWV